MGNAIVRSQSINVADMIRDLQSGFKREVKIDGVSVRYLNMHRDGAKFVVGGTDIQCESGIGAMSDENVARLSERLVHELRTQRVVSCIVQFRNQAVPVDGTAVEERYDVMGAELRLSRKPNHGVVAHIGGKRVSIPSGATNGTLRLKAGSICGHMSS